MVKSRDILEWGPIQARVLNMHRTNPTVSRVDAFPSSQSYRHGRVLAWVRVMMS